MVKNVINVSAFTLEFDEDWRLITEFNRKIHAEKIEAVLDAVDAMETPIEFIRWIFEDIDEVKKIILINALHLPAAAFKKAANNRKKHADTPATVN